MPEFLRRNTVSRSLAAIIAAYALALQMLLGGIVVTQMAAAGPAGEFVLCEGGNAAPGDHGKPGLPVDHLTCVVCSLLSFSPPLPEISGPVSVAPVVAAAQFVADNSCPVECRRFGPHSPRGPPRIA